MPSTIRKYIFYICFVAASISFFARTNYRSIEKIKPEVIAGPVQSETADKELITVTKDGYEYKLTPLYDYRLDAMVVHTFDYTWFSIYKLDSVFPRDLCVIWGKNVESKVYQSRSLSFGQDYRFCLYNWTGDLNFDGNELSNNHLLLLDKKLEKKAAKIKPGDQIELRGKLVNVEANNLDEPGTFDPKTFSLQTSTTRTDTGAGACEIIYVDDIKIISSGHPFIDFVYHMSLYGILIVIIWGMIEFFWELSGIKYGNSAHSD
jgi:hypothetical protein